jgi:putative DNA primase/helicase
LPARPSRRCFDLLRTSAAVDLVPDAVAYLQSRNLWPLPKGCPLRAHAAAEYWDQGAEHPIRVGKFPALLAPVVDIHGERVTVHITYLQDGKKIIGRAPRKLLSGTHGRVGCAVRLMPMDGSVLAVAEGIETALAASRLLKLPCWSCLNTSLLSAFTPPPGVEELIVAVDNDAAGRLAAEKLVLRLATLVKVTVREPFLADFAADLVA